MRRFLFTLGLIVVLINAPALFACETCLQPGEERNGTVRNRVTCWTECQGEMTYCVVKADYSGCSTGDLGGDECPDCDAGGGPGGGGSGSGGGSCSTTMGACPPQCFSCGGGGGFLN